MATKAEIMTVLGWDDAALVKGVNKASNLVTGLSKKLASLGTGAIGGTFKGLAFFNQAAEGMQKLMYPAQKLGELMLDAFGKASDMEQTQVAFKTLVGSAEGAQKVLQELVTLGAETPFEFPELATAGRMLIAFGEDSKTVAETLRNIGDVSSGIAAPIGEIAEIYGKVRVQNQLFAEDINQFQGRGIPVVAELAKITGQSATQIKKLASEGKITFPFIEQAFINLTSKGGLFFEGMKDQSKTFAGLKSNLADVKTALEVAFGTPIIKSLKPLLESMTTWLGTVKVDANDIGQAIGKWVEYLTGAFKAGVGMDAFFLDMKIGFTKVAQFFESALESSIPEWIKDWYTGGKMALSELEAVQSIHDAEDQKWLGQITPEEANQRIKNATIKAEKYQNKLFGNDDPLGDQLKSFQNQRKSLGQQSEAARRNAAIDEQRSKGWKPAAEGEKKNAAGLKAALSALGDRETLTGMVNKTIRAFSMGGANSTEMNESVLRKQLKSRAENIKTQLGSRMGDTNYPGAKAFEGLRSELKLIREQVISIGSGTRGGLLGFSEGHSS